MNAFTIALAITVAAAAISAQAPTGQLVDINNHSYLTVSSAKHANAVRHYQYPPCVPNSIAGGSYSPASIGGGGATPVTAGTILFRIIPKELENRQEARQFMGTRCGIGTSAATYPTATGPFYFPEINIRKTVARAGGGLNPDFVSPALVTVPQATQVYASFGNYITTSALMTAIPFTGNDYCITATYKGGEHDDIPQTEAFFGDWAAGFYSPDPMLYGHAAPAPAYTIFVGTTDQASPFLGPLDGKTSIAQKGDYAHRRQVLNPTIYGANDHRIKSDCATLTTNIGWDMDSSTANGGGFALFLMNIAPTVFPGSFSILGVTVELNIADPALALLGNIGYVGNLNPQGDFVGSLLPLPALPFLVGQLITVEGFVIDATLTTVVDSSGTTSFKI